MVKLFFSLLFCFVFTAHAADLDVGPGIASNQVYAGNKTLNRIIAETAGRTVTIIISEPVSIPYANLIVPPNVTLEFTGDGRISCGSFTLTIQSSIANWPSRQIFASDCSSTGSVSFSGNLSSSNYSTKWWGSVGDGTADDTAEVQMAIDAACSAGGGSVWFEAGRYKIATENQTGGPDRMLYVWCDNLTIDGDPDAVLTAPSGQISGGSVFLVGGMIKASTPAGYSKAFNTQNWYIRANASVYYPLTAVGRGAKEYVLASAGDGNNFAAGDILFARTGQTISSSVTEPDAEINTASAVSSGTLTLKWPAAKPLAQEYFISGTTGKTSTSVTANAAVFGVANVTARTLFNFKIRNISIEGPSDANFFYIEQVIGLEAENVNFRSGRALWTTNNVRDMRIINVREHHDGNGFVNFAPIGSTGTVSVISTGSYYSGKGFVHCHEGAAQWQVVNSIIDTSYDASNVDASVSFLNRQYDIIFANNRVFHDRPSSAIKVSTSQATDGIIVNNAIYHSDPTRNAIEVRNPGWRVDGNKTNAQILTGSTDSGVTNPDLDPVAMQVLRGFVTYGNPSMPIGTIPYYACVDSVVANVSILFNSDGTDQIDVGYSGNTDGYANNLDVSTAGRKTAACGSNCKIGFNGDGAVRTVVAAYTAGGSAATQGRAAIAIFWYYCPGGVSS